MKTVAFVPLRLNSKRVTGKNLKSLGGIPLLTYIFNTLLFVDGIDEIYAFCSSREVIPFLPEKIKFLKRDEKLDGDLVLGQEIYDSFCRSVSSDYYILAHATSPFIKASSIEKGLDMVKSGKFDSAFSAEKKQTFVWYKNKPLNYSPDLVPRTQDIEPVYVETSAFFIFTSELWKNCKRRIGDSPYIHVVDFIESIDIDYPEDFEIAEKLIKIK
jgi:CMP-N-acetylneuraminic acid synthetase